ncbi:MAG: hypothetical protein WD226_11895 [Planctomycetota bacterium]
MILPFLLAGVIAGDPQATADEPQASGDLQAQVDELNRRLDLLSRELETREFAEEGILALDDPRSYGVSPTAARVYDSDGDVSIGGYGEVFYQNRAGSGDTADALRGVLYIGKRFDDRFVLNSEFEFEHAGTSGGGSSSIEFLYLDWLMRPSFNLRFGLLLVPMGLVNELHEPTTFLPAMRPVVEQRIIPSTWRENGIGAYGDLGPISYTAYVINGLDASGFSAGGLRGGRQKGSRAMADDLALVVAADYTARPGLVAGGSVYVGDSGQSQPGIGDAGTEIAEVHVDYRRGGWRVRALFAMARLDDVDALNAGLGLAGDDSVGEELRGGYLELGYDVLAAVTEETRASLTPFARYETLDTQASVPSGFASADANDEEILTFGVAFQPISSIIFKVDYEDRDQSTDRWNASIGYIF